LGDLEEFSGATGVLFFAAEVLEVAGGAGLGEVEVVLFAEGEGDYGRFHASRLPLVAEDVNLLSE
jgi:hypothetical protein